MTRNELENFRKALLALRARLTGNLTHLAGEALRTAGGESSGSLSNTPLHMADLGTDNFEQEFTLSLIQNEEQVLGEIGEALDRIDQGKYGQCEECGGVIAKARLQAIPYARHCVKCARKVQEGS